ncbi:MAG: hypothetical protein ABI222_05060 [Opitutaceae bacterium]
MITPSPVSAVRAPIPLIVAMFLALVAVAPGAIVKDGITQDVKMYHGGGGPTGQKVAGDFLIQHSDGFKGAKRVAISVFNVAFPDENSLTANMHAKNNIASYHNSSTLHTALQGVDQATRQRIADAAYESFVSALKQAGYEVVERAELSRLAPEYTSWTAVPNFSSGRFGAYVAPTGRSVYFLPGDTAKRDVSGKKGQLFSPFRALDRPQAFKRSPYLAHDANLGIVAVTLVIDYGVYSTTGESKKLKVLPKVDFLPGVTAQAGSFADTGTLAEYWGTNSGGFAAMAVLAAPVRSDEPFAEVTGGNGEVVVKADAAKFEHAAIEVARVADARLVAAMAGQR